MLLGRQPGHRLEDVAEVGRPLLDRPVLHRVGDRVGGGWVQRLTLLDRRLQRLEHRLREPRLLHLLREDVHPVQFLRVDRLEVDVVELVLAGANGLDGGLTRVRTHVKISRKKDDGAKPETMATQPVEEGWSRSAGNAIAAGPT
jgi:hypothetical protein